MHLDFGFAWDLFFCDCEILDMMFSPGWYDLKLSSLYWFRCWCCMWLELLVLCPSVSSFSLVFLWFFSGLPQSPKFDLIWWDLGWFLLFPIRRVTVLNLIHFDLKKVIARYYYSYYCYYSYHCFFLWHLALFTNNFSWVPPFILGLFLLLGSLSKDNVTWKCNFAFSQIILQLFKVIVLAILSLSNWKQHFEKTRQNWTFVIIYSRRPHKRKTGHFMS